MSILASLTRAYTRLKDVPPFGYSKSEVGFCIVLRPDGQFAFDPIDLRTPNKKRAVGPKKILPSPLVQRTSGIKPNFLWDKTSYALGISSKESDRIGEQHHEFVSFHKKWLADTDDEGLIVFKRFLDWWRPDFAKGQKWENEIKDQNVVFALVENYHSEYLHERDSARKIWSRILLSEETIEHVCLVTGQRDRIALSHPPIKNVDNAQSSGAFIVSFNDDAYRSYGHEAGDNAPVSEKTAFQYTAALNHFLEDDSGHRLKIGDASTVFWADAEDAESVLLAEATLASMLGLNPDLSKLEEDARKEIGILLEKLRRGSIDIAGDLALEAGDLAEKVGQGVRIHVLGLAPNAARLSIRFYYESDFKDLARNYRDYVNDFRLDMGADDRPVSINRLVLRTAPARRDRNNKIRYDRKQVSPLLSGELFRSILTGDRFPRALLAQTLMRIRSDHHLDRIRVALIKAVIVRDMRKEGRLPKEDYLVRSDPDDPNPARRLGKLFAIIERAQRAALGDDINTNVRDKYLASAAATPAQVMSKLIMYAEQHHIKRLRNGHSDAKWIKDSGHAKRVGRGIGADLGRLAASFQEGFPAQHSDEEQGLFLIGYYQERYGKRVPDDEGDLPDDEEIADEGDE